MKAMTFRTIGIPVAQPRVKARRQGSFVRVYTPGTADAWKAQIVLDAKGTAQGSSFDPAAALRLEAEFYLPRPKSHTTTKGLLKSAAPGLHISKPDLDNLIKALLDALVDSGALPDDRQVIMVAAWKCWAAPGQEPGAYIKVEALS